MSVLDLSSFGLRAIADRAGTYRIEDDGLVAAVDRFRAAAEALSAAWEALPVAAREHLDGSTFTLHAHPDQPRFSEEWDAQRGVFTVRYGETWSRVAVEAFAAMTPAQRETVRAAVVAAAGVSATGEVAILATKHDDDSVTFQWEPVPKPAAPPAFATGGLVPDDGSQVVLSHDSGGTRAIFVGPDGKRRT